MFFKDGTIYDGEFKGGKICGRGRKIKENGEIQDKYWDTVSPAYFNNQWLKSFTYLINFISLFLYKLKMADFPL